MQTINIGTLPNDNTGDALRVAFSKCNNNFAELNSAKYSSMQAITTGNSTQNIYQTSFAAFNQGTFKIAAYDNITMDSVSMTLDSVKNNANISVIAHSISSTATVPCSYDLILANGNVQLNCIQSSVNQVTHKIVYQIT